MLQIVTPTGDYNEKLDPNLSKDDLTKIYRIMLSVRTLDSKLVSLQRQGKIAFHVPWSGQEAAHIGAAYALTNGDWIFPAYREPGAALLRGVQLKHIFAHYMGNSADLLKGHQWPCLYGYRLAKFVTPSAPVSNQIPEAVGVAMAAKFRGDKIVSMVYFGDGATSQSDFHVGMNFAGVFKAPVIFMCQNNQYCISLPVKLQTATENLAGKAVAYGFPGIEVDGNDVLAVYSVTKEAVDRARDGGGPTLIEAVTYRIGSHSTNDDASRYRGSSEVEEWRKKDPIDRFRLYLLRKGTIDEDLNRRIILEVESEVNLAAKEVENAPPPKLQTLFEDVYDEPPWNLLEQAREAIEEEE